jgi:hypothetical protein
MPAISASLRESSGTGCLAHAGLGADILHRGAVEPGGRTKQRWAALRILGTVGLSRTLARRMDETLRGPVAKSRSRDLPPVLALRHDFAAMR